MEKFKEWWESITVREQHLTLISAIVIGIAILFWGIWTPLTDQLATSQKQLNNAETTLSWTQEKATILLGSGVSKTQTSRGNLTQILNSSAKESGITFSRIVNRQDNIEVWITKVEFNLLLKWLTALSNESGVSVLSADLTKTDQKGYIKVNRLLLGK